jgi:hypothetical protein
MEEKKKLYLSSFFNNSSCWYNGTQAEQRREEITKVWMLPPHREELSVRIIAGSAK